MRSLRGLPVQVQPTQKKRKATIPKALREQVWLKQMGRVFEGKCPTIWCQNKITVFNFESGHNIPESKGGPTTIENLIPLCGNCNKSMASGHTFHEWCAQYSSMPPPSPKRPWFKRFFSCF
jgi:hypothetical protein